MWLEFSLANLSKLLLDGHLRPVPKTEEQKKAEVLHIAKERAKAARK